MKKLFFFFGLLLMGVSTASASNEKVIAIKAVTSSVVNNKDEAKPALSVSSEEEGQAAGCCQGHVAVGHDSQGTEIVVISECCASICTISKMCAKGRAESTLENIIYVRNQQ